MAPQEILIIGAGIAGPPLATFLLLQPLPVTSLPHITILERSPNPHTTYGQNVDIRGAGATVMRKLGLESAVRAYSTGEEGAQFVDERNRVWFAGAADKTGEVQTGTSDKEILRGDLARVLGERLRDVSGEVEAKGGRGVEWVFGERLESLEQDDDAVTVRFAKSGEKRRFDIVVGADGLMSSTRTLAFGEESCIKNLGMYTGFFSLPSASSDSAWRRWFHAPGRKSIMIRPSGHPGRTTAFMAVLSSTDSRLMDAAKAGRKGVEEQRSLLASYFANCGWECPRLIREMHAAEDFYYSPVAQVKLEKFSKGRVVLLGDAAYCASPISGMGTTLALVGAYTLAGALAQYPRDHGRAFEQYETMMRPVVAKAQKLAPGMPWLIHPETAWGVWFMHALVWMLFEVCGLYLLAARFKGPPANEVPVDDYGFRELEDKGCVREVQKEQR